MTVAAVVLAAGGSSRFRDGHKLVAGFRGRPLWEWAVEQALGAGLDETVVVVGAQQLDLPEGVTAVENPDWSSGIATSLQAALRASSHHEAVVVGLADQPAVTSDAYRTLAQSDALIAVATYGGRRGNPVRLARAIWDLLPTTGDEGARVVMRQRPDLVVEVECRGDPADVDTREDLIRWS